MRMFKVYQDAPVTFSGYWLQEPFYIPECNFDAEFYPKETNGKVMDWFDPERPPHQYFYYGRHTQKSYGGGWYRIMNIIGEDKE